MQGLFSINYIMMWEKEYTWDGCKITLILPALLDFACHPFLIVPSLTGRLSVGKRISLLEPRDRQKSPERKAEFWNFSSNCMLRSHVNPKRKSRGDSESLGLRLNRQAIPRTSWTRPLMVRVQLRETKFLKIMPLPY